MSDSGEVGGGYEAGLVGGLDFFVCEVADVAFAVVELFGFFRVYVESDYFVAGFGVAEA